MRAINCLTLMLFVSLLFISSSLIASGPVIKDGTWEAVLSEEMNIEFDEQISMLEAMAKSDPSMQIIKDKVMQSLNEAREPKSYYLSEEQAERGVISIFEAADKATQESGVKDAGCTHEIEWLEKNIGAVTGTCEDGSIIKGEISVPSDLEIHYKGTVTPEEGNPHPVGWDAKWLNSYSKEADDLY